MHPAPAPLAWHYTTGNRLTLIRASTLAAVTSAAFAAHERLLDPEDFVTEHHRARPYDACSPT